MPLRLRNRTRLEPPDLPFAPAAEMRIIPRIGIGSGGRTEWVWICPCHGRTSAGWPEAPTSANAWAEHDRFPPAEGLRAEGPVNL
jgi:hypothetical protein